MIVNRAASLVLPFSSTWLIDDVVTHRRAELLWPLTLAVGAAAVIEACTAFALSWSLGMATQRAIAQMRTRLHARIMRLPVQFFDSTQTGALVSRIMTDTEGLRNLVGQGLAQLASAVVTVVLGVAALCWLNWRLTAVTLVGLGAFGAGASCSFRTLRPMFRAHAGFRADVAGRLTQTLAGIRVVKSCTTEKREEMVFARGAHRMLRMVVRLVTVVSATTAGTTLAMGSAGALLIYWGGHAIIGGAMTTGALLAYTVITAFVIAPLATIASVVTQVTEAFAGLDRMCDILQMRTELEEDRAKAPVARVRGDVRFEDVSFAYRAGQPVLAKVSCHARPGTTTAIVGSAGSGKSTLIRLLLAFDRPVSGRILIDGRDLATLRRQEYRAQLAAVLQDTWLFDGSFLENVAYARPDASRAEIEQACKGAHCEEFILRCRRGYDTSVGERGVRLSGGQRQRIAIARAMLANPPILILDEATSNLDSDSEEVIQDGLRRLRSGRTTFVVAHRLSTIRSADQILVLERGAIVERGTHDDLLVVNGRYRELHDRQYAAPARQTSREGAIG